MKLLNVKGMFLSVLIIAFFASFALAQGALPAQNMELDFFKQIISFVQSFGGYSWGLKISGICMIIVSSMKVSFLKPLWDKLGSFQVFAAPFLGVIIGLLNMGTFSWAKFLAYFAAGIGASYLYEILDLIKLIPGIGKIYISGIDLLKSILHAPKK